MIVIKIIITLILLSPLWGGIILYVRIFRCKKSLLNKVLLFIGVTILSFLMLIFMYFTLVTKDTTKYFKSTQNSVLKNHEPFTKIEKRHTSNKSTIMPNQ